METFNKEFIPEILRIVIEFLDPIDYISFKSTSKLFHNTFLSSPESILFKFQKNFEKLSKENQRIILEKQKEIIKKEYSTMMTKQKCLDFWKTWKILISWAKEINLTSNIIPEIPYFSGGSFEEIDSIMKSFQILSFDKGSIEFPFKMIHTSCDVILNNIEMKFSFVDVNCSKVCVFSLSSGDDVLIYLENDDADTIDFEIKIDKLIIDFNNKIVSKNQFFWDQEELYGFLYLIAYSLLEV